MTVEQLPGRAREFAAYLDALLARLDRHAGWCAVFWQRDPESMRACLDGREVPPWDVVEALLQDLAEEHGAAVADRETERARALHDASLTAYDARPGGRAVLGERLGLMLREQRHTAERQAELGRRLRSAASAEEAEALQLDLDWARDDHERATARCAELRRRMARLDRDRPSAAAPVPRMPAQAGGERRRGTRDGAPLPAAPGETAAAPQDTADSGPRDDPAPGEGTAPGEEAAPVPKRRARRRFRGGARFAGAGEAGDAPAAPAAPDRDATGRAPRGARFAGAVGEAWEADGAPHGARPEEGAGRSQTRETVETLLRLRAEGRSGEAHVVLVEAAYWPADRLPELAAGLHRAGLHADWATLLWEAASLPVDRLVAAAAALGAAGRTEDGRQMLRQGVVRPAPEIGAAVLELAAGGRHQEVSALLDAYVRMRTPEESARSVAADPARLVPLLLEAARGVSQERHWDVVHALRVAGFAT
ncbi:hypothetical protein [Streptomyces sp. NPDC059786]|uniref:hypothetical protein n=1 Tax=Streptomyces sp. NPDC059786 TaxID=3346946 RepID=UPI0036471EA7